MQAKVTSADPASLTCRTASAALPPVAWKVAMRGWDLNSNARTTPTTPTGIHANVGGGYAHYGANKAAIVHYTRYLAQELGPHGINANCMAPGFIATGRVADFLGEKAVSNLRIALRRPGMVEDCAKVLDFLATDLSDYVSGVMIPVDGGMY